MSDPRDPDGGPPVDSDAFHEWVEHTASARGVDEQELLNQLVSAFWVLDEMSGVTGENDAFGSGRSDQSTGSPLDTNPDDDVDTIDFGSTSNEPTEPSSPESNADPNETADEEAASDDDSSTANDDVAAEIRTLRESLHTQLEMVQAVGELRRQLSDLSLDVENQRSRQDKFTDRISDDLTRLHNRVEELDSKTAELASQTEASNAAGAESLDRLAAELRDDIESLEATQQEFESWIETEFDEIEGLFEHLLELTDGLDERLAAVETEVEAIREDDTDRERLEAIRRSAHQTGVKRAACGSCDTEIDISMLAEPRCPECSTEFGEIKPASGWNPFSKARLQTDPSSTEPPEQFK